MGLAAALALVGVLIGQQLPSPVDTEVAALRDEVRTVGLALLDHQSASERLLGVEWSRRTAQSPEVVDALLERVQYDSNLSVRLAAVDALRADLDRPDVIDGLAIALARQESPLLQVALTDALLAVGTRPGDRSGARRSRAHRARPDRARVLADGFERSRRGHRAGDPPIPRHCRRRTHATPDLASRRERLRPPCSPSPATSAPTSSRRASSRRRSPVPADEPLVVIVKNIIGPIRVTGHDGNSVEMHATETVRGDLQADIERARAEMQLRTESEPGRVAFRVRPIGEDGEPATIAAAGGWDGYSVEYDIEVRVPRGATLEIATVNDGDVTVEDVNGEFELKNVNGAVRLVRAGGSGTINTVNGDVDASFARAPSEATSFQTVNGELDVTFPANLSAELAFHTMQGDVFTDFDVESLSDPPEVRRDRGRFVMNMNRTSAFRVGTGGERHSFNTLNGDIFVRKAN